MIRAQLLRGTPLRQALLLLLVFACLYSLALGGSYLKFASDTRAQLQADLARQMAELDLNATPAALAAIVAAKAEANDPQNMVFVFLGKDGTRTGNARSLAQGAQLHLLPLDTRPLARDYIKDVQALPAGVVIVAKSLTPLDDLRRTFAELFWLTLLPTGLLSLLAAFGLAHHSARRLGQIEATLTRLSEGDMSARVTGPDGRRRLLQGEDLERIATGLNHMASRQQTATEALRQVSTDIAHDLRTPLQRLSLRLEALERALPAHSPEATAATEARAEADQAIGIFRALLQIARIEGAAAQEMETTEVELNALAAEIADLYRAAAEDAGRSLTCTAAVQPVRISANGDLLMQALVNLVENALRHGAGTITIEVTPQGIAVCDEGPGIPQAERDHVRRRLYRLDRSRSTPGHGLGLALVDAIAQAHGAQLRLGPASDHGGLRAALVFPAQP